MKKRLSTLGIALLVGSTGLALGDDFAREGDDRQQKDRLEGREPPALQVTAWMNTGGRSLELASLKGKVVVLDFWGTWWGPCRSALPKLKELEARYRDQGLVLIGVHTTSGGEKMAEFAEEQKIGYPIAIDVEDRTTGAFAVDSYPDYTLIDRSGKLRVADLANADLERAVQVLLAEKAPPAGPLAEAGERAKKKDKRLLVVWGSEAERAPVDAALKKDRDLSKLVRNEYEVVRLARAEHGELAGKHTAGEAGLFLAVLDPAGKRLASIAEGTLLAEGSLNVGAFREFLEKHRVPVRDAEKIWRAALARAEQENKRLLVHLGAPWWGWCFKLEEFLGQPEVAALLARDYIDVKIDTERHRNGAEVAERLRQGQGGGLPWTVITDSGGAPLITSDGPDGNIGCPVSASETAYFVQMIRKTARELDEAQIGEIAEALERYAAQYRR